MRLKHFSLLIASLIFLVTLTGCDSKQEQRSDAANESSSQSANKTENQPASTEMVKANNSCPNCGLIVDIEPISAQGESSGAGAVMGALVGGLLGNQVGSGSGKKAATVAGAVGGAVAGNEIEKRRNTVTHYAVTVQMEDGSRQVVKLGSAQGIDIGTRVEIIGNDLRII